MECSFQEVSNIIKYVITSVVVLYSVIPTLPAFLPKNQEKKQKIKKSVKTKRDPPARCKNNAQAAGILHKRIKILHKNNKTAHFQKYKIPSKIETTKKAGGQKDQEDSLMKKL